MSLVYAPSADNEKLRSAMAAVPGFVIGEPSEQQLFPPHRHTAQCRICAETKTLTEEHLPPRGAFNKGTAREIDFDSSIGNEALGERTLGKGQQGGLRGFMLCESCNSYTGRFGREYQEWARRSAGAIGQLDKTPEQIDAMTQIPTISPEFADLYPGRFVRQVISMMLSVSGGAELGITFPDLPELALGGPPRQLPDPLRLYLNLYADGTSRIAGGACGQGRLDLDTGVWRWLLEVSVAPLSTILLIDGPPDPSLGVDITDLTNFDPAFRHPGLQFEAIRIGFGHLPFPGDFRTAGQLMANRGTHIA